MYIYIFVGEKSWRAGHYIWQWHGLHGAVGLVWYWGVSLSGQPREDCSSLGGQWWTGGSLQSYSSPLGLPWQLPLWLLFIDSSSFFFWEGGGRHIGCLLEYFLSKSLPIHLDLMSESQLGRLVPEAILTFVQKTQLTTEASLHTKMQKGLVRCRLLGRVWVPSLHTHTHW